MLCPLSKTSPVVGSKRPNKMSIKVDFPAPVEPTIARWIGPAALRLILFKPEEPFSRIYTPADHSLV